MVQQRTEKWISLYSISAGKAGMTKQGKAKQADVYFFIIIVLLSKKSRLGRYIS